MTEVLGGRDPHSASSITDTTQTSYVLFMTLYSGENLNI